MLNSQGLLLSGFEERGEGHQGILPESGLEHWVDVEKENMGKRRV